MKLTEAEVRVFKTLLRFFKIARRSEPWLCTALLTGNDLRKLIAEFEQIIGWTKEDESAISQLVETFAKETEGHSFKEKSEKLSKLLNVNGSIVSTLNVMHTVTTISITKGKRV